MHRFGEAARSLFFDYGERVVFADEDEYWDGIAFAPERADAMDAWLREREAAGAKVRFVIEWDRDENGRPSCSPRNARIAKWMMRQVAAAEPAAAHGRSKSRRTR